MTSLNANLEKLADPTSLHEPLNITGFEKEELIFLLSSMLTIRYAEQCLARNREQGLIGGPVHLGVGQEAVAVGISASLHAQDRVFSAHRSHAHLLALGADLRKLFAEILGKDTGHSKGMGGSMHLWDESVGFYGSVPIVAGTVPLSVGAGLAAKFQNKGNVAVSYLGDGAVEEGVVHESLNLARVQNIPVIFVVENNLFASHMHISERQPCDMTARFAEANRIPAQIIDGNDVLAVLNAGNSAIARARAGQGPSFIEVVTYRWYGHVDWRDDIDVGVNRSKQELANWKAKDPVARLREAMLQQEIWSQDENKSLEQKITMQVDEAWAQAMKDPYPAADALLERVYKS